MMSISHQSTTNNNTHTNTTTSTTTNRVKVPSSSLRRVTPSLPVTPISYVILSHHSTPSVLMKFIERNEELQSSTWSPLMESIRSNDLHAACIIVDRIIGGRYMARVIEWDVLQSFQSKDTGSKWFDGYQTKVAVQGTTKKIIELGFLVKFLNQRPIQARTTTTYLKPSSSSARTFFQTILENFDETTGHVEAQVVKLNTKNYPHQDASESGSEEASSSAKNAFTPMSVESAPLKCSSKQSLIVPAIDIQYKEGHHLITQAHLPEFAYKTKGKSGAVGAAATATAAAASGVSVSVPVPVSKSSKKRKSAPITPSQSSSSNVNKYSKMEVNENHEQDDDHNGDDEADDSIAELESQAESEMSDSSSDITINQNQPTNIMMMMESQGEAMEEYHHHAPAPPSSPQQQDEDQDQVDSQESYQWSDVSKGNLMLAPEPSFDDDSLFSQSMGDWNAPSHPLCHTNSHSFDINEFLNL